MSIDALTLDALAPRPYWVAWQTQDRPDAQGVNKPTKGPVQSQQGGSRSKSERGRHLGHSSCCRAVRSSATETLWHRRYWSGICPTGGRPGASLASIWTAAETRRPASSKAGPRRS